MRQALPLYREAVRLKPDFWIGYNNIMYALVGLGDEEGAMRAGEQLMKVARGRPGRAPEEMYQNYDQMVWDLPAVHASNIADMESNGGIGTTGGANGAENLGVAQYEVQMHDVEVAALRLKTTPVSQTNVSDVSSAAYTQALLDEERGDLKAAAREWDTFAAAYANPTISTANPPYICFAALTYEKTRQPAKADAALNAVGALTFRRLLPVPGRRPGPTGRLGGRAGVAHEGREACSQYALRLLLVGHGARKARRSRWGGGQVQGRPSEGAALG